MKIPPMRIYSLKDARQYEHDMEYWRGKTPEERLSAVEVLRRQYTLFSAKKEDDDSKRLRRILRIVQ